MGLQDCAYKDIFSHREVIENLMNPFFNEVEFKEMDISSLEKVNSHYISGQYRKRESDVVWKMRYKGEWLYLYVLLEFQSTVDRYMSIRLMSYIGLLYEDLIKSKSLTEKGMLPPVLPWVIYTGKPDWSAPLHSHLLLEETTPIEMKNYFPHFRYHLLEVGRYSLKELEPEYNKKNLVALLIELEQSEFNWVFAKPILERLDNQLQGEDLQSLRRAFAIYAYHMLKLRKKGMPPMEDIDLKEVNNMLAERIQAYESGLIQQGWQEGKEEGSQQRSEAIAKEMLNAGLDCQLISKFTFLPLAFLKELEQSHGK